MIGKLLAAFIGNRIDREDGKGGVKGAMIGLAVERLLTRMGPIGWVLAGLYLVIHYSFRLIGWLIFGSRRRRAARH